MRMHVLSADMKHSKPASSARLWGDYWLRREIIKSLSALGVEISSQNPDVCLLLLGYLDQEMSDVFKIVWIHSHPDLVRNHFEYLRRFNKVFCLSSSFTQVLHKAGYSGAETMTGASSKKPPTEIKDYGCDVAFVGNPRPKQGPGKTRGRRVITPLLPKDYKLKIWGQHWSGILPGKLFGGKFFPYDDLADLYGSVKINLNDQHGDMARDGFPTIRVFDILASGGFCISAQNPGIEALFGEAVPQFRTPDEELHLIDYFLAHDEERERLCKLGLERVQPYTWESVAKRIVAAAPERVA